MGRDLSERPYHNLLCMVLSILEYYCTFCHCSLPWYLSEETGKFKIDCIAGAILDGSAENVALSWAMMEVSFVRKYGTRFHSKRPPTVSSNPDEGERTRT